ncbi:MAG: hypothetical protein KC423_17040, partial [Anaerolineales bacterium]|nr:hypothetical protein [Anaerolineales bacterium]
MMLRRQQILIFLFCVLVLFSLGQAPQLEAATIAPVIATPTVPTNVDRALLNIIEERMTTAVSVIIRKQKTAVSAEAAVEALGGQVGTPLPIINGFAATLPTTAVYQLAQHPAIKYISLDATISTTAVTLFDNLLSNPGFEEGTAGWDVWGEAAMPVADAHAGSQALRVGAVEGGSGQIVTAVADQTYTLNGWFKISDNPIWAGFGLDFLDSNYNEIGELLRTVNTTSYQQFSLSGAAPIGTAYIRFWMWKSGSSGYLLADDLSVSGSMVLENPGFENGLSSWHIDGDVALTSSSHSGSQAVRIGTGTGGVSNNVLINVVPNQTVNFTGWFRVKDNPEWAGFGIDFLDGNQEEINDVLLAITNDRAYQQFTVSGTAPAGSQYARVWVAKNGVNGYLD